MVDTIFALATGVGRSAIAVVRMSGPATGAVVTLLCDRPPPPREARLRHLRAPATGEAIDRALVIVYPAPRSVTGEDCAEFHLHGGRAVVSAVLQVLADQPGCRMAMPGEFTRRALRNGRLDLAEVEGLADLIEAETEAQRRQALRQLEGALGQWAAQQRERLLLALAAAESAIDFSDEGDVAGDFAREVRTHAADLIAAIDHELTRASHSTRVREGLVVAIAGPPNAGKSTLLNALAKREAAIVSPHAGTTRDPIEVQLDLDGYLVHLVDTAGLRATDDPVEQQGIRRALDRAQAADLVLWLSDARHPAPPDPLLAADRIWPVATKIDLADGADERLGHSVSAISGQGVAALIDALKSLVDEGSAGAGGIVTRARHRAALAEAKAALTLVAAGNPMPMELAAEQIRYAATCLDSLTGRIDDESVLGAIFERFCVGK